MTTSNDFIVWDPHSYEQLVHTPISFSLSFLYSLDECIVAACSGHLLFILPSSGTPLALDASSPSSQENIQPSCVCETKRKVQVATNLEEQDKATITLPKAASPILVRESEKGREVEGSLLGRRSLVYSQHLSSLRVSHSARCSSLTKECREYLKKLPQRSIEAENLEEYLLSNRMLGLALFNEEDIAKYDRLARQKKEENLCADKEISATLKQKLSHLTHTCVIDDAEHALMGSDRSGSYELKKGGKGESPPPLPRREYSGETGFGNVVANPLLKTLFSQGKEEQHRSRSLSEEDLGLFDVTNYYSIDEIAELCEHSSRNQRRKDFLELPIGRLQKPVNRYARLCLTTRRQSLLKKLFLNTITDNEEYRSVVRMVSKLMRKKKGYEDLSDSRNTPENLAKLRTSLQSLNMTFEEIDAILGDESDYVCLFRTRSRTI